MTIDRYTSWARSSDWEQVSYLAVESSKKRGWMGDMDVCRSVVHDLLRMQDFARSTPWPLSSRDIAVSLVIKRPSSQCSLYHVMTEVETMEKWALERGPVDTAIDLIRHKDGDCSDAERVSIVFESAVPWHRIPTHPDALEAETPAFGGR